MINLPLDALDNLQGIFILPITTMNDSTLDLFCEHEDTEDAEYADEYAMWIEELASKYEVTCDYIIQEFILDN